MKYVYGRDIPVWRVGDSQLLEGTLGYDLATTQKPFNRPDLSLGPTFGAADQLLLNAGLKSGIEFPLISNGKTVGILTMLSERLDAYGDRDQIIVERLARQIAPAIENANLFETSQRAESENAVMAEIGRVINSSLDIEMVYQPFANQVQELIQFDRLSVITFDEVQENATIRYATGLSIDESVASFTFPLRSSLTLEVVSSRSGRLFQATSEAAVAVKHPWLLSYFHVGLRSWMVVPLFDRNEVAGVLLFSSKSPEAYSGRDMVIAERIADQVAGAIANSQLYERSLVAQDEQRCLAQQNSVVAEIGRIINSSLDIEQVYEAFVGQVETLVPFDWIVINLVDLIG